MSQRGEYAKHHKGADVTVEGLTIVRETDNAILVQHEGDEHWIPLSQVSKITRTTNKGQDTVTMTAWIAGKKGLA